MNDENNQSKFFNPITFTIILLLWNWIGGFLLHYFSVSTSTIGIFYLSGTLIWSMIFGYIVNREYAKIGLTRKVGFNWKAFSLIILAMIIGAIFLTLFALLKYSITLTTFDAEKIVFLSILPLSVLIQALFEEVAWTGWLYSNIKLNYTYKTLVIASIWAVWHVPFTLWGEQFYEATAVTITLSIIHLFLVRFILNWYRKELGNVWWPTFYHGGINLAVFVIVTLFPGIETFGLTIQLSALVIDAVILSLLIILFLVGEKGKEKKEE